MMHSRTVPPTPQSKSSVLTSLISSQSFSVADGTPSFMQTSHSSAALYTSTPSPRSRRALSPALSQAAAVSGAAIATSVGIAASPRSRRPMSPSIALSSSSAAAATPATSTSAATVPAAGPAATTASAPAPQVNTAFVADLIRRLAAFRRGLLRERKERQLLELQLEESQLRIAALESSVGEADVQLMTSLELSARLEQALQMSAFEPLPAKTMMRDLELTLQKPRAQMEEEIKRLFEELLIIQQMYHVLDKKAVSDRVQHESTALKLSRDLKVAQDASSRAQAASRKATMKLQDALTELADLREVHEQLAKEHTQARQQHDEHVEASKKSIEERDHDLQRLRDELNVQQSISDSLTKQVLQLSTTLMRHEQTLVRFRCFRLLPLPSSQPLVPCEITIKQVSRTGEMMLGVRDIRSQQLPTNTASHETSTTASVAAATVNTSRPTSPLHTDASSATAAVPATPSAAASASQLASSLVDEYQQELTTVHCRVLVDDDMLLAASAASTAASGAVSATDDDDDGDVLALMQKQSIDTLPSSAVDANASQPVAVGMRPRFLLLFTADNYRCLAFESSSRRHFERRVLPLLMKHLRVMVDKNVDELGNLFGDASPSSHAGLNNTAPVLTAPPAAAATVTTSSVNASSASGAHRRVGSSII